MMQTELHPMDKDLYVDSTEEDEREGELDFSEKLNCLEDAVMRHPLNREILYSILGYCETERPLVDIEDYIMTLPQFKNATQNQYRMIKVLEKAYGLTCIECDEFGQTIDPAIKEGMTEDEIDDLVAAQLYQTTDVGTHFVEQHKPQARIIELLDLVPERADTYHDILAFINETPRSYNEITQFLDGCPTLETVIDGKRVTMQPSVFLDKLERSGALVWDGKWTLTKEGGESLSALKSR